MERCLLCFEELPAADSWFSFLFPKWVRPVCRTCDEKLERIQGDVCECCGRPLSSLSATYKKGALCLDCVRWGQEGEVLEKNRSLYMYNDEMKEVMNRFKFRGDAVLIHAFANEFREIFRQYFSSYEVVPIPLSTERLQERGFNQAELLAMLLPVPMLSCSLVRVHTEKQSQKTRKQRIAGSSPFSFLSSDRFDSKNILLIDDIYTTGKTVRQLAVMFRERGAKNVSSLTLCRS